MKNAAAHARKLKGLLRRLKQQSDPQPYAACDPVTLMVLGFLQWNANRRSAQIAYQHLMSVLVDNNDLRVSQYQEVLDLLGPRYPQAAERVGRMRDALQEVFVREHGVSLRALEKAAKKDVRSYLDSLPGMVPYVAALVTLVSFGGHAVPVDDRLYQKLAGEGVIEDGADLPTVQAFLEHQVHASEGLTAHLLLQHWSEHGGSTKPRRAAKATKKKTTKAAKVKKSTPRPAAKKKTSKRPTVKKKK